MTRAEYSFSSHIENTAYHPLKINMTLIIPHHSPLRTRSLNLSSSITLPAHFLTLS
ncbi:hypothetical protein JHK86_052253 [Glycine max]|nr:hypothetical protein JHK86_052253 [Glycine max]